MSGFNYFGGGFDIPRQQVGARPYQIGYVARQTTVTGRGNNIPVTSIAYNGTVIDFARIHGAEPPYSVGDAIWMEFDSNGQLQIAGKAPEHTVPPGVSGTVKAILSEDVLEAEIAGMGTRAVYYSDKLKIRPGDAVIVDRHAAVVIHTIKKTAQSPFALREDTKVTWDDVAGLDDAKQTLREAVELITKHAALYTGYAKRPIKGIMLVGPPGCGKTMLAKAFATALRETYGARANGGFFHLQGPSIINKYVGVGEQQVRELFAAAKAHEEETKEMGDDGIVTSAPSVIFIDEADALFSERGDAIFTSIERKMVPQFLSCMDGIESSQTIVLIATNKPEQLDSAITRHGRINRTVHISRPTVDVAQGIFGIALRQVWVKPMKEESTQTDARSRLANDAAPLLYQDCVVTSVPISIKGEQKSVDIHLRDMVDGAMIVEVVEKATSIALHRDIAASRKRPSGVTLADIEHAVAATAEEMRHKNLSGIIREVAQRLSK